MRIPEWGFDPFHGLTDVFGLRYWINYNNFLKATLAFYKPVPFKVSYLTAYWREGLLRRLIMTGYLEFCWEWHYAFMILIKGSRKLPVVKIVGQIFKGWFGAGLEWKLRTTLLYVSTSSPVLYWIINIHGDPVTLCVLLSAGRVGDVNATLFLASGKLRYGGEIRPPSNHQGISHGFATVALLSWFELRSVFPEPPRQSFLVCLLWTPLKAAGEGTTEDEMIGWPHWLDGNEFEWTPGVGDGQGGLACCSPCGHKESETTERLNWAEDRTPCSTLEDPDTETRGGQLSNN